MNHRRIRLVHVISGLDTGGAEVMLYRLLSATDRSRFDVSVISLRGKGQLGPKIEELGISVEALVDTGRTPGPLAWARLATWLKRDAPDVVQTWLYHADLLGGLAARWAGRLEIVWGVHATVLDPAATTLRTRLTIRLCAILSRWVPTRIVCCAEASREMHAKLGYPTDKMDVIPNGFDVTQFNADSEARAAVRGDLGIPADALAGC